MTKLEVVGSVEAAGLLQVDRQTLRTWLKRGHMPEPDARLSCGPVWRKSTIIKWASGEGKGRVALVQKLGDAA